MDDAERYRKLTAFVRRIRHDASNPLTAALGNVQLLLEDASELDPEVRDTLFVVESELRRLGSILRQMNEVDNDAPLLSDPAEPAA
jgi:signal transduction histidine kinase